MPIAASLRGAGRRKISRSSSACRESNCSNLRRPRTHVHTPHRSVRCRRCERNLRPARSARLRSSPLPSCRAPRMAYSWDHSSARHGNATRRRGRRRTAHRRSSPSRPHRFLRSPDTDRDRYSAARPRHRSRTRPRQLETPRSTRFSARRRRTERPIRNRDCLGDRTSPR